MIGWCARCEDCECRFVNFLGIQIKYGVPLKGGRILFIFSHSLQKGGNILHTRHNEQRLILVRVFFLRFRQDGSDFVCGSLDDQPEVAVASMQTRKSQIFQDTSYLSGCQANTITEAGHNLAGGDVTSPFQSVGFAVKGEDQLTGRVGRLETPVASVEFVDLFALKPIAETVVEQGFCLCVDGIVVDRVFPRVVDVRHFKNEPTAIAGIVGKEERIVAGGAERGDVRQAYFVAAIGKSFVDVESGGHRLELVQLRRAHGVDLFEINQEELREGQQVVLTEPLAVGLRREVTSEAGWQQVLHERSFITSLAADQHEDDMVDCPFVQCTRQHAHEPAAEVGGEFFRRVVRCMYHRSQLTDRVARAVPGREGIEIVRKRMVFGYEVAGQQRAQAGEVCVDPFLLHGTPQGVFDGVGHALPLFTALQSYFRLLGEPVAADFHVAVDEMFHLFDRGITSGADFAGSRLFKLPELLCSMFGRQSVAAFCCGADGSRIIVGKRIECPCRSLLFRYAEPVHPVETAADVVVVTMCLVGNAFLFDKAAHGRCCPLNGRLAAAFFLFACRLAAFIVRQRETERVGLIESIGIITDDGHTGRVFAFAVIFDTGQPGIMFVDMLPGQREILFCNATIHPCEHPDTGAGDRGVGQEGMRIVLDTGKCLGELPGRNAIDVDHDESGIADGVFGGTSACERDRGDEGRLVLFDSVFFCLQLGEKLIVAVLFRLVQAGDCLSVQFSLHFMKCASLFIDNRFP